MLREKADSKAYRKWYKMNPAQLVVSGSKVSDQRMSKGHASHPKAAPPDQIRDNVSFKIVIF